MTLQLSYRDKWYSLLLFSSRSFSFQTYYGLAINLQILPVQRKKKMKQNDKKSQRKESKYAGHISVYLRIIQSCKCCDTLFGNFFAHFFATFFNCQDTQLSKNKTSETNGV